MSPSRIWGCSRRSWSARDGIVSFCEAAVDDLGHRSIRNADLVIVLGGPIGVYETGDYPFLTSGLALIEYRLSRDLPTLGICLGSQLMAKALGSRVFKGPVREIGWGTIDLTEEGRSSCLKALQDNAGPPSTRVATFPHARSPGSLSGDKFEEAVRAPALQSIAPAEAPRRP